jgi:hypothetical protein
VRRFTLLYIIYFSCINILILQDFANSYKEANYSFASKGKWTTENIEYGDVLSKNEIIFSNLLFLVLSHLQQV